MDRENLIGYARVCGFIGLTGWMFYNSIRKNKVKAAQKKAVAESKGIRMMTTNLLNKMMMIGMKEPGGSRKRHMEPPGD